jgi:hypothetical protein
MKVVVIDRSNVVDDFGAGPAGPKVRLTPSPSYSGERAGVRGGIASDE